MAEEKIEIRITAADAINAVEGMTDLMLAAANVIEQHKLGNVSAHRMRLLEAALNKLNGKESLL